MDEVDERLADHEEDAVTRVRPKAELTMAVLRTPPFRFRAQLPDSG